MFKKKKNAIDQKMIVTNSLTSYSPLHKSLCYSRLACKHFFVALIKINIDNFCFSEKPDCTICQGLKKIATRSSTNLTKAAFKKRFYDTAFPVKVRDMPGYGDVGHSFEKFMEFYHANQADLEQGACEFKINGVVNESVKSLADVLKNWDHYMPAGNIIGWLVIL